MGFFLAKHPTVESDFVVGTQKFDFTVDEEKGLLSPLAIKNRHCGRKVAYEKIKKKKLVLAFRLLLILLVKLFFYAITKNYARDMEITIDVCSHS